MYTEHQCDPQEAFRFAVAYEEGLSQHLTFKSGLKQIKNEPVLAIDERRNPSTRGGLEFTQNHLTIWNAEDGRCRHCNNWLFCTEVRDRKLATCWDEAILQEGMNAANHFD